MRRLADCVFSIFPSAHCYREFSCQFAAGPCALDVQQAPEAPLAVTRVSSASDVAADTMRDAHIDVRQDAGEKTD